MHRSSLSDLLKTNVSVSVCVYVYWYKECISVTVRVQAHMSTDVRVCLCVCVSPCMPVCACLGKYHASSVAVCSFQLGCQILATNVVNEKKHTHTHIHTQSPCRKQADCPSKSPANFSEPSCPSGLDSWLACEPPDPCGPQDHLNSKTLHVFMCLSEATMCRRCQCKKKRQAALQVGTKLRCILQRCDVFLQENAQKDTAV